MIPLKLKMRNFMCYQGDVPELDFTGLHTACISGDNGNGKSAIIDAMTWALWDKSRARKTDDDLISLGKDEMEIDFTFAVGDQVFRIVRKHARPKKATSSGQSSLDFLIQNGTEFKVYSGNTSGETQQRIINVLHMDYDTFINSALILQGRADEFTLKPPAKRAEVLSEILGFSYYDALAQDANEMARAAESTRLQLEKEINADTVELVGRETAEADKERTERELAASGGAILEQGKKLDDLKRRKEALEAREGELKTIDAHLNDNRRVLQHLLTEAAQHQARLKEFNALIAKRREIEANFTELAMKRKADAEMGQKLRTAANLSDQKHKLEMRIEVLKQALTRQHDLTMSRITELEKTIGKLPDLKREAQKSQEALKMLERREAEVLAQRQALDTLRASVAGLKMETLQLDQRAKEADKKIEMLNADGEKCPLCGSPVGEEELNTIRASYSTEIEKCQADQKTRKAEAAAKQKELDTRKDVARLEDALRRERPAIQSRAGVIEKALLDSGEAEAKLNAETERKDEIEGQINRREFAAAEEKMLSEIESELTRLSYDGDAHTAIQKRVAELEQYADLKRRLEEADKSADGERAALTQSGQAVREVNTAIESDTGRRNALAAELVVLPDLRIETDKAEKERQNLVDRQRQIERALFDLESKLKHFAELEKRRAEKRVELARASDDEKIYKELTVAFGKKGVQQMFIEAAIPEIEEEANRLLARMTDNRMHLKIDTLRQKKSGDAMETLDINISDELGTRPYEMYSGGEAFRINFAIRIALAKVLARRAGAPMPTLIIDEGFGTQDATGIEKVKEAISAIQGDFQRIMVITHIAELRDAFPNRITVVKGPNGSTIETV